MAHWREAAERQVERLGSWDGGETPQGTDRGRSRAVRKKRTVNNVSGGRKDVRIKSLTRCVALDSILLGRDKVDQYDPSQMWKGYFHEEEYRIICW